MTYNDIALRQRILDRISDDYDKDPGGMLYEAVSPVAYELADVYFNVDNLFAEAFIATATGTYLDTLAADYQMTRETAVPATVLAELVGADVPVGTRFASVGLTDSIYYKVIQALGDNLYYLQGAEYNAQANYYTGTLTQIDYVNGLTSATITAIVIPQTATETDDEFRTRIQENLIAEASDGNVAQYTKWLSEIDGVGKSKVTALAYGDNTVGCMILDELNQPASDTLLAQVQETLDPDGEGLGEGLAPIGAKVTVTTPDAVTIDIAVSLTYKDGATSAPNLEADLRALLADVAFDRSTVSYLQVAAVVYASENVDYINSLTVNDGTVDITIDSDEVAVLGDIDVT